MMALHVHFIPFRVLVCDLGFLASSSNCKMKGWSNSRLFEGVIR
jgi:hypothetical protein